MGSSQPCDPADSTGFRGSRERLSRGRCGCGVACRGIAVAGVRVAGRRSRVQGAGRGVQGAGRGGEGVHARSSARANKERLAGAEGALRSPVAPVTLTSLESWRCGLTGKQITTGKEKHLGRFFFTAGKKSTGCEKFTGKAAHNCGVRCASLPVTPRGPPEDRLLCPATARRAIGLPGGVPEGRRARASLAIRLETRSRGRWGDRRRGAGAFGRLETRSGAGPG